MTSADSSRVDQKFLANAMASFLQIGALLILIVWCFTIVRPFISIVAWAAIIAIAVYPMHQSLTARLGGREKTSATIFVLITLGLYALFAVADVSLLPTLVLVVIASDVAGYFAGKSLGGPKFWPRVSPKKTWSGTMAGWVGAAGVGAAAGFGGGGTFLFMIGEQVCVNSILFVLIAASTCLCA